MRLTPRWAVGGLLLVTLLAYQPLWSAGFVYEDANAVVENRAVTAARPIAINRARWLSALSHRVVFEAFGGGPRAPHLTNLALHLVNGSLVYAIAGTFVAPWAAVLVSGVFLVHPLQTEAVAYVASRSELLATLFGLTAFLLFLHTPQCSTWNSRGRFALVWGCVVLGICAKESIAVIVPLMVLYDWMYRNRWSWLRGAALLVPVAAMAVSVFHYDFLMTADKGAWHYAALQATALWRYLAMVVVPVGQTVDHDFELVPIAVQTLALLVLLWSLVVLAGGWLAGARKAWLFALTWVVVALLPRFVMRIPEYLNEHQLYTPFVGVSLFLGAVLMSSVLPREGVPR